MPIQPHVSWNIHDGSKIKEFTTCPRKYFFRYILGWAVDAPSVHLVFGEAWHNAMAILLARGYEGKASIAAVREAHAALLSTYRKSFGAETDDTYAPKNPGNALLALNDYVVKYEKDDFRVVRIRDAPLLEVAGSVPISDSRVLWFRIDGVIEKDGKYYILEHKTAKSNSSAWMIQWIRDLSIGGYLHALYAMLPIIDSTPDASVGGTIINAAFFKKTATEFLRITNKPVKGALEQWLWEVNHHIDMIEWNIKELQECEESDPIMMAFPGHSACTLYFRPCEYHDICTAWPNPLRRCAEPPSGFKVEWWDPRDFVKEDKKALCLERR